MIVEDPVERTTDSSILAIGSPSELSVATTGASKFRAAAIMRSIPVIAADIPDNRPRNPRNRVGCVGSVRCVGCVGGAERPRRHERMCVARASENGSDHPHNGSRSRRPER